MSLTKEEFGLLQLQRKSTKILLGFGSIHGNEQFVSKAAEF